MNESHRRKLRKYIPHKNLRSEWIKLLKHRYKTHQQETLDHKDCREIAELLEEKEAER